MGCAVNAATGREVTNQLSPAVKKKRVVVIGGGAGGMEAARVADLRGHHVTLLEKQSRLGGSMLLASTVHSDNETFYRWQIRQMQLSGVDIRLGQEANAETLRQLRPDAIVVATGAKVETPAIPGADGDNVLSGAQLRRLVEGTATAADAPQRCNSRRDRA